MSLNTAEKQKLIETHQVHQTDTGSAEVQVAMLSKRISKLSDHLQGNIHDFASRQGLLKMIGKRKRLLSYIKDKKNIFDRSIWTAVIIFLLSQQIDIQYFDGRISLLFWILLAGLKCINDENKSLIKNAN